MVEILRISPFVLNFILFSFPRSAYPCTPLARQPKISAQNPFAQSLRGASVFRRNRIKKAGALLKNSASAFSLCKIKAFKVFKVEILRISPFKLKFFILFPFPRSAYPCTPLARQPKISAQNPFALFFEGFGLLA